MSLDLSRRRFLESSAAAAAMSALPLGAVHAQGAKYVRYNATSREGEAMLASYDRAIQKLLSLPVSDPRNWFRNAFIHTLDCPHGNWWFFVWHRPYIGYFEQTVREFSGNPNFAFPYWDWTQLPAIPGTMFKGALTPTSPYFNPYISSFETFRKFIGTSLDQYWKDPLQAQQLQIRQMPTQDALWKQVTGNPMFAVTSKARWITASSPGLDPKVAKMCDAQTIRDGLAPTTFIPFNSQITPSHTTPPGQGQLFGTLEGLPHNNVHNNVGGAINSNPSSEFGYMQDNLSPVDPLFMLHHSNMDRLLQIWNDKQTALKLPYVPEDKAQYEHWANDVFLFYINSQGQRVTQVKAGSYIDVGQFNYAYSPGSAQQLVGAAKQKALNAKFAGSKGSVAVTGALADALASASTRTVVAQVTVPHPGASGARNYDVTVNAPPGAKITADSPYYVATIAFFGNMPGMAGVETTFTVPITELRSKLKGKHANALNFQVTPQGNLPLALGKGAPLLKSVAVEVY